MVFFTAGEVCDFLRISRKTLTNWRQRGIGPRALKIGGQLRFSDEDLNEFLSERYRQAIEDQEVRQHVSA